MSMNEQHDSDELKEHRQRIRNIIEEHRETLDALA
jgi:hypothetical protein